MKTEHSPHLISMFVVLFSIMALAQDSAPPPICSALEGVDCRGIIQSLLPCVPYLYARPINESAVAPPPKCCEAFSSLLEDGKDPCICDVLRYPSSYGLRYPIDVSWVVSLPSTCAPHVQFRPLNCSGLHTIPFFFNIYPT